MVVTRIKISSVVENQLPSFVRDEFPLVNEFLSEYYSSLEYQGGVLDLLQNIDRYIKLDQLTNLVDSTTITSEINLGDATINVQSTKGFPDSYGLLKIGSEIITYKSKTNTSFNECVRGFSGVISHQNPLKPDNLIFTTSAREEHVNGSSVLNLSILFLKEFYKKVKKQFSPGFDERDLFSNLNQSLFIKQAKDFYSSKGTDQSFEILFRSLYGEDVEVIKPRDYLFTPSDAQYRITKDLIVEEIEGNPFDLLNRTLYQDEDSYFKSTFGSVNNVEKVSRGGKDYYAISLDYDPNVDLEKDSQRSDFSIHSQTKLVTSCSIGSDVIDVDSTIGFPNSGFLVADLSNGTSLTISYTSKSYTQFYGCTGIDQELISGQNIRINSYAYGFVGSDVVKVRVTGVLSNLNYGVDTKYHDEGESIQIKTIGKDSNDVRANNWIFNIATTYDIDTLTLTDLVNFSYRIVTIDNHSIYVGDSVKLIFTDSTEVVSSVVEVLNQKSFIIADQGQIDVNKKYKVQKLISKTNALNFSSSNIYSTNVQNTYQDGKNSFYVTSSSLPSYLNQSLLVKDRSVTFSGFFNGVDLVIGNHGFYTGDAVFYSAESVSNSLGIQDQIYFVNRVNSTTINLSRSRSNLYEDKFISFNATVTNNKLVFNDFYNQTLDNQKLVRNILSPEIASNSTETSPGPIGILVNGVEILNYKSRDSLFYGPLEEINVLSPGSNYDVINPPILSISDPVGFGATGFCEVEGEFEEIQVIDGGFDYITEPVISVTGGSGSGVQAKAQLIDFSHAVSFNATSFGDVNLTNDTITFSNNHKFRNGEVVIYDPEGQQSVGGLSTNSTYYISTQTEKQIKIHTNANDALTNTNPINLTSYGVGNHRLISVQLKKKISSVILTNKGTKYKNRKISISPVGINTFSNIIEAKNHGYSTGDIIVYSTTGSEIGGLQNGKSYFVTSLDENSFKLSNVGTSSTIGIGSAIVGVSTSLDFYFKNKQYVNLSGKGTGNHIFNYPQINVSISGKIGVFSPSGTDYQAVLQPIVRGQIKSVFLESGGTNYGSEKILNFNRQASITLKSGQGAEVIPVLSNGKIVQVLITNPGSGYNSPPTLIVSGPGIGAKLTPIISNGSLTEVKVINGGVGYDTALINVVSSGTGAEFKSVPQKWTVNLVERNIQSNQITDDDGIIDTGINSNYGLQYTHLYAPRKLRQTIFSREVINGQISYLPDLKIENGKESLSNTHSPIIGWAYDGNPIYGPYGYSTINGGSVKPIESGYYLSLKPNRPSTSIFPEGFFVEDYSYRSRGDLDEYNGRFCVTPEFPNGVYAYFATIDGSGVESSPPFRNYRKPVFPYFIGNSYKSKPNQYNFSPLSNQDNIDLKNTTFFRNTTPYNLLDKNSGYDFIVNSNNIKRQNSIVRYVKPGIVDSIGIKTGGFNYKIGNKVIFDNSKSGGQGVSAEVNLLNGKQIRNISVNSVSISGVEFISNPQGIIGFATSPHNLSIPSNNVIITGLNTSTSNLNGNNVVGVRSETFLLSVGVGTTGSTGIVTYFSVFGPLDFPNIRENDVLKIDSEKLKVLNIDRESSRIRVLREYEGSTGSSHTVSSLIYEDSRKFTVSYNPRIDLKSTKYNKEIYFNPPESIGIGTTSGIGIGATLFFSNPGVGASSLFIPTRTIYLPNHNLSTGDELIYSSNGGNPITASTNGISTFQLVDDQIVYVAKVNDSLIGIATNQVGVGSTGIFVGINSSVTTEILYFTDPGLGEIHSFTTNYKDIVVGEVNKNLVTVSTAETHGLNVNDIVNISCLSGISTTYVIKYDDYNRRMVIDPKSFISGDVDASNDTIQILSHGYITGQKVIHTSSSPAGGLENGEIYFVVKVDNNRLRLAKTYYDSTLSDPNYVNITSVSSGTLSLVNPPITGTRNQQIIFDVSDSSLSYNISFNKYPAFKFDIYTDSSFDTTFDSRKKTGELNIIRNGILGVDANATVTINLSNDVPNTLYYQLTPVDYDTNNITKLEIISDSENILDNNKILVNPSIYSGRHSISGIGSTTFSYTIFNKPEKLSYTDSEATLSYTTNSLTASGGISSIRINSGGYGYESLPAIVRIDSLDGSGAVIEPSGSTVGRISLTEILDIGFEYSSDPSIRPIAKIPQVLKLKTTSSFERIGISSIGKQYNISPDLIVIDSITKQIVSDVDLRYKLGDKEVTILKNTGGISNSIPEIIPINNPNGVGINSISYNESTKEVTVGLAVSYSSSNDYPFSVGDKVIIENTRVGFSTSAKGYNSSSYGYALFTLKAIDPNIGGANGTVTYSLGEYLSSGENPGVFNLSLSAGRITPQKFFPIFDVKLKKNELRIGEIVSTETASGTVEKWYFDNDILVVSTTQDFKSGDILVGSSSKTKCSIELVFSNDADYNISATSLVKRGWNLESGFLNNDYQRIHDSDYYQYFSYSLKSKIEYEDWKDPVSSMNHTAGFKKFSNLIIESNDASFSGISTEQNLGDFTATADIINVVGLNCVNDFDLARENKLTIGSDIISDEIILNSSSIQDYFESVGNRVLVIDDISSRFNSNPRPTPFSAVDSFDLSTVRSKKYISYIVDRRFTGEKQISVTTLLHNDLFGFLNQYGRVETANDLGSFDFIISGSEGQLLFYPTKFQANDYSINLFSYDIKNTVSGIGTINLGDTVKINSSIKTIPVGFSTTTNLVSFASTYRASKIIVQYAAIDNSYFEYDELTIIHDGSSANILEYGQLSTNILSPLGSSGIGTYSAYLSGSEVKLDFTPNVGLSTSYHVNSILVSIANTSSSGISSTTLRTGKLESAITSIASSTSPTPTVVSEYENTYSAAYYIASVEDTTNNQYQISEIIVVDDGTTPSITEFGILHTSSNIGNFDASISGGKTKLTFTPIANSNVEVRVFQNSLRFFDENLTELIDFTNALIDTGSGTYDGTESDIRRIFELTHKGLPIFRRNILGNSSTVVDLTNNLIKIPNHYFVTGEELRYTHSGQGTSQSIGISTETIVGVGTTDKLPQTVYVIKVTDAAIRLASSAENALKTVPIPLIISSVGIGTSHALTSKKQNTKVLISIDNVIQSPVVSSALTSILLKEISSIDQIITVSGITSFFSGDLIEINNEIMKVDAVGFGSTNVFLVKRPWMGTGISSHANGSLVKKIEGDYNIIDNTINFVTAPYGLVPIGTFTDGPNNIDYLGISTYSNFSGRSFIRSGIPDTDKEPYTNNYIFNDISPQFTGYSTSFILKSNGQNITGISTDNAIILVNQVFQGPKKLDAPVSFVSDYVLRENSGITSIQFSGFISTTSYDVNNNNLPRGGIIVSVGASKGFGYQPIVAAGGTAIISGLGTVASISIGNSGSGYRSGLQVVKVGVKTENLENVQITYVGTATISDGNVVSVAITNPGTGYTTSNPPFVVFDDPLNYFNLPLVYSSLNQGIGIGTGARVNVVVGQGSSVIDFEITNFGYGYGQGEILTVGVGGTVGIPTNTSLSYSEFNITVDRTFSDTFSGWTFGNLLVLDSFDNLFDGIKKSFQITSNGSPRSIRSRSGSNIDVESTLLVFINDILQVPGEGYIFDGGSFIDFTEAPKSGDKSKLLFYQGTSSVDVTNVDILETIKPGDIVRLNDDNISYKQNDRLVTDIISIDTLKTNPYKSPGLSDDQAYVRPIIWCKQTDDLFINGKEVGKDRVLYEPLIYPNTRIIQTVGSASTIIFVESVKTFFDSNKENYSGQNRIRLVSQENIVGASATAIVSIAGTISSISITNSGLGYTSAPTVIVGNPVGLGSTQRALATSTIFDGSVTSIQVSFPGTGYTSSTPPSVLIDFPRSSYFIEDILSISYSGDFGIISGISTTTVGVASTGIIFDLVIPQDSFLRDTSIVGTALTVSGIQTGYYFVVYNSNVGSGVTSLRSDGSIVSIGSSFLDNVYYASKVSIAQTSVSGFGVTYVAKVTVSVSDYNGLSGIGYSSFFGEYSWGRISAPSRPNPKNFTYYNNGLLGISTSPIVERFNPLKYSNYN